MNRIKKNEFKRESFVNTQTALFYSMKWNFIHKIMYEKKNKKCTTDNKTYQYLYIFSISTPAMCVLCIWSALLVFILVLAN